jgi:hypothetical protein
MGDKCILCLEGYVKERYYLGNLCVDRLIILKLIWKTKGDGAWGSFLDWIYLS